MIDWIKTAELMAPNAKLETLEEIVPLLEEAMRDRGLDDEEMMIYALATIRVETWGGDFKPVDERPNRFSGLNFERYDRRSDLGNIHPGDGKRFRGRGLAQITGRYNYDRTGRRIGVDLIANPELACEPKTATVIVADLIKQQEKRIREAMWNEDYRAARRVWNAAALGLDEFVASIEAGFKFIETGA